MSLFASRVELVRQDEINLQRARKEILTAELHKSQIHTGICFLVQMCISVFPDGGGKEVQLPLAV